MKWDVLKTYVDDGKKTTFDGYYLYRLKDESVVEEKFIKPDEYTYYLNLYNSLERKIKKYNDKGWNNIQDKEEFKQNMEFRINYFGCLIKNINGAENE